MVSINTVASSYKTLVESIYQSSMKASKRRPLIRSAKAMALSIIRKLRQIDSLKSDAMGFWGWLKIQSSIQKLNDSVKGLFQRFSSWTGRILKDLVWYER